MLFSLKICFAFEEIKMGNEQISNKSRDEKLIRLGLNICFQRKLKHITQSELAKALNINRSTVSCIESQNNPYRISIDLLLDISEYLQIPPSTLFEGI